MSNKSNLFTLNVKVNDALKHYMMSEGFPEDEVYDYTAVEFEAIDNQIRIEVRAEVSYDGLMDLCERLDPIVQSVDPDSYFEPVTSGIIESWVSTEYIKNHK